MGCSINIGSAQLMGKLCYKSFSSTVYLKLIKIVNCMLCGQEYCVAISFSREIFPTQGLNPHLLHW